MEGEAADAQAQLADKGQKLAEALDSVSAEQAQSSALNKRL